MSKVLVVRRLLYIFALALMLLLGSCSGGDSRRETSGSQSSSVSQSSSTSQSSSASSMGEQGKIHLNQLGYLPHGEKLAVVPAVAATEFTIVTETGAEVLRGNMGTALPWAPAGESVKLADFSALTTPGSYRLRVGGVTESPSIIISERVYDGLNAAAIKAFYFQRVSTPLLPAHAGAFAREAGHPDTEVLIHASAADASRPEGTVIASPRGWYDAGDYNKYIVNSGISTYTLLAAFEHFPDFYRQRDLTIPESGDEVPDVLDEVYWNLAWMLTMQDPHDGGVYHKLTNKLFDGIVMPHEASSPRYLVQKGTGAALNFAAVMATASRIFAEYDAQYPGLAAQMLTAAEQAWHWAQQNPSRPYQQPIDILTGAYADNQFTDEFAWAAVELYITTGDAQYLDFFPLAETPIGVSSWNSVRGLPWISLGHHRTALAAVSDQAIVQEKIEQLANQLLQYRNESAYAVAMRSSDFVWGSNAVVLNQAIMLIQAYRVTENPVYLQAAQSHLDYVLGRNPTGYSFVTGFGTKTPMHIHHRPSEADGITDPIPGFLAGGAQPGQQDKNDCPVPYPSTLPAKSYLDHWCSYASNEVAINWNAPLVYVSGALQALTPQP